MTPNIIKIAATGHFELLRLSGLFECSDVPVQFFGVGKHVGMPDVRRTASRSQKLRMLLTHRKLLPVKAIAVENDLRATEHELY
jgi:hypothetical protein